MRFHELGIQTQRQAPSNARMQGFALLVRAAYLTRENTLTSLGEYTAKHLRGLQAELGDSFFKTIGLEVIGNVDEKFSPIKSGSVEVIHCLSCKYTERIEAACFTKSVGAQHAAPLLPIEKIPTPDCNTIESLASYLGIPKEKTAKALMFTRLSDKRFIFVVLRGDMQLSDAKLKAQVGELRVATAEEIAASGAAAGYASPIGLKDALIVADDLIPKSANLVAGANEIGYHFKNTNYGRDYSAEIVADVAQAREGDACPECGQPLSVLDVELLRGRDEFYFETVLLALAEAYHDDKGLTIPKPAAPFDVYLMQLPGKELDTRAKAEGLYSTLESTGISVLFDDRDERAGVKFNDADLIGPPLRVTVGEKNLREGMVELKARIDTQSKSIKFEDVVKEIKAII